MQTRTFPTNCAFLTRRSFAIISLGLILGSMTAVAGDRGQRGDDEHWVATWSTVVHQPEIVPGLTNPGFNNQTLRQILHITMGGQQVRVRLSTFGASALTIGGAHIAISAGGAAIVPGSDRPLTFGGNPSVVIPPGAPIVSDPVDLTVRNFTNLAVSLFVPEATGPASWHFDARQTSYISPAGDYTATPVMPLDPLGSTTQSWFWLAGIDVLAPEDSGAVAALGDSITDGAQASIDANHRWTDRLVRRILAQHDDHGIGVLNEGLDGNRLLHDELGSNGLARFERDVLSQPGLAYVIVQLGNADIGTGWPGGLNPNQEVTVDQILQGYQQLVARAHTRGVRIYGATLTPFQGSFVPGTPFPLYSPENEVKRQQVNQWIRTSRAFDGVIDFDAVLRDPHAPARLLGRFDSGDHVHPNDAGTSAMADAIDLRLFDK
jgi:lysophospholipase L1-like esterase